MGLCANLDRAPGRSGGERGITLSLEYSKRCQNPKGEVTKREKEEKHGPYFSGVPEGMMSG